jgi:hypothetical protein
LFFVEAGGNLQASLQAMRYFVGGLEDFTVVWLKTPAASYYETLGTDYLAAGRNIPEGRSRWEAAYLITFAVN